MARTTDSRSMVKEDVVTGVRMPFWAVSYRALVGVSLHQCGAVYISPLSGAVPHIVCMGAEEKMIGIYAECDIAFVKNMKARWDRTINQHPSNSVCANERTIPAHLAILMWWSSVCASQPQPASIAFAFRNLRPESFGKFFWIYFSGHSLKPLVNGLNLFAAQFFERNAQHARQTLVQPLADRLAVDQLGDCAGTDLPAPCQIDLADLFNREQSFHLNRGHNVGYSLGVRKITYLLAIG